MKKKSTKRHDARWEQTNKWHIHIPQIIFIKTRIKHYLFWVVVYKIWISKFCKKKWNMELFLIWGDAGQGDVQYTLLKNLVLS